MNTIDAIVQIIQTVGFPIAGCVGMAWYVKYITDANRNERKEIQKLFDENLSELTGVVQNNTLAITKLCERIGERINNVQK